MKILLLFLLIFSLISIYNRQLKLENMSLPPICSRLDKETSKYRNKSLASIALCGDDRAACLSISDRHHMQELGNLIEDPSCALDTDYDVGNDAGG